MKHTEGPWEAVGQDIRTNSGDHILTVPYGDDPEKAEARARLIAAAPRLLQVLEVATACHNKMCPWCQQQFKQAIAKAEGR